MADGVSFASRASLGRLGFRDVLADSRDEMLDASLCMDACPERPPLPDSYVFMQLLYHEIGRSVKNPSGVFSVDCFFVRGRGGKISVNDEKFNI